MAPRILVIEDEPSIAETTIYALSTDGFETVWAATGQQAMTILQTQSFDLALLDVGLPDINGFEVFRQIKHLLPVIFLTARSGEIDRIVGLELGADDYIAKPFSPRELCAKGAYGTAPLAKAIATASTYRANAHPKKAQ